MVPEQTKRNPNVSTVLADEPPQDKQTIIVIGAARGGTSAVAGVLRILGLNMGTHLNVLTHEDIEFLEAREPLAALVEIGHEKQNDVLENLEIIIKNRNNNNDSWGWKDPLSFHYIDKVFHLLVNPRIIFIYRDYYSISERENIESNRNMYDSFKRAHEDYKVINELIYNLNCPKLVTSYEKISRFPFFFTRDLVQFLGIPADAGIYRKSVEFLSTGKGYVTLDGEAFEDIKRQADEILEKHPELRSS